MTAYASTMPVCTGSTASCDSPSAAVGAVVPFGGGATVSPAQTLSSQRLFRA